VKNTSFINIYEFDFIYGDFVVKSVGIKKSDLLGGIMDDYPEVAPVLAQAGLHCIGCHVSGYETLEQGCMAHGMAKKDVDEMVKLANKRIAEYEKMPKVTFTQKAIDELLKRKGSKKFVRLMQIFGGEFDFAAVEKKEKDEIIIEVSVAKKSVGVLASKRIERMLRGVKIDYNSKKMDFVAERS
ncbi:MAG: DUF1858 domain-containing protein, partial [archaeon]